MRVDPFPFSWNRALYLGTLFGLFLLWEWFIPPPPLPPNAHPSIHLEKNAVHYIVDYPNVSYINILHLPIHNHPHPHLRQEASGLCTSKTT